MAERGACGRRSGFTLLELLVAIAIVGLLIGILFPSLSKARGKAKSGLCQTRLRQLGQGLAMYAHENRDYMPPGRMPRIDDENWTVDVEGGRKYRPTFLAMMGSQIGVAPFSDPQKRADRKDRFGEAGDRQDYAHEVYTCPEVPDWTDERNGAFGYNYQFLGNARLRDPDQPASFKNWPNAYSRVKSPSGCVAVGDCMGTAATYAPRQRHEYVNNGRDPQAFGDEGFNLDPPLVDPVNGELAGKEENIAETVRTALHPRHVGQANVLWVDGHGSFETHETMGYQVLENGSIGLGVPDVTHNRMWTLDRSPGPWLER